MTRPHAPSVASRVLAVAVLGSLLAIPPAGSAQTKAEIDAALAAAHAKYKGLKEGKNADYIPALAKVPSNLFGIAARHRPTARSTPPATSTSSSRSSRSRRSSPWRA